MSLSRGLAETVCAVGYDDIDAETVHAIKVCLADGLACMIAARGDDEGAEALIRHAISDGGDGASSVIGETHRLSPALAALANGSLAHVLDFEDTFEEGMIHPNAPIIPAVLALSQHLGSDGRSIVAALAIGCDVACRLSLALTGNPADRGWYHPPMISGIGAVVAVAHLLRLTPEQTVDAIGLATTQFQLDDELKRSPQSSLRAVRDGFAARAAVEAAMMARSGLRAVDHPIEGPSGFAMRMTGRPIDEAAMLDGLGVRFHCPAVGIKRWPSCRGTHGAIAAALDLRRQGATADMIRSVEVNVSPPNDMLFEPRTQRLRPQTAIDAKFSIPFVFAATMARGAVGLDSFEPDARNEASTLALAELVSLAGIMPAGGTEGVYAATLHDGRRIEIDVAPLPVWRAGQVDVEGFRGKIVICLARAGRTVDADRFLSAIHNLEAGGIGNLDFVFHPET